VAGELGTDWLLARLAYDQRTRGPVEFHRARLWVDVFADLVALDALDAIGALYESPE